MIINYNKIVINKYPGVGQLVDGVIWVHEASGSSPDTWTMKIAHLPTKTAIFRTF